MSVTRLHSHYGIVVDSAKIGAITKQNIAIENEVNGEPTSGEIYRRWLSLYKQRVAPGFSTLAIAAALDAVGVVGASIDDMAAGLTFYAQKHAQGSSRSAGAVHRKFTMTGGILVPRTLTVEHGGDATLDYEAVVTFDGVNDPVVWTDAVTLPTGFTDGERFTLGPTTLGGELLEEKTRMVLDFGITAEGEGADSDIWATLASIRTVLPSMTLDGLDIEWLKSTCIPLTGKQATHANSTVYLRKRKLADQFEDDATAEHIALTVDGMIVPDEAFSASDTTPGTVSLTVPLRYDGTNAPMTIDTSAAIS